MVTNRVRTSSPRRWKDAGTSGAVIDRDDSGTAALGADCPHSSRAFRASNSRTRVAGRIQVPDNCYHSSCASSAAYTVLLCLLSSKLRFKHLSITLCTPEYQRTQPPLSQNPAQARSASLALNGRHKGTNPSTSQCRRARRSWRDE